MASRFALQAREAMAKAQRPDLFCKSPRCLWRTPSDWCPRHSTEEGEVKKERLDQILAYGMSDARTASGARPNQKRFRGRLEKPMNGFGFHAPPKQAEPIIMRDPETGVEEVLSR